MSCIQILIWLKKQELAESKAKENEFNTMETF